MVACSLREGHAFLCLTSMDEPGGVFVNEIRTFSKSILPVLRATVNMIWHCREQSLRGGEVRLKYGSPKQQGSAKKSDDFDILDNVKRVSIDKLRVN